MTNRTTKMHNHTEANSVRLSVRHADGKCEQEVCNGCVVYCVSMEDAARRVPGLLKDAVEIILTAPPHGPVGICALCNSVNLRRLEDCPVKIKDVAKRMRRVAQDLDKIAMGLENAP